MRVSTRSDYGLRALIELAGHYGGGPLQSSEIAGRRHIPEQYLDQLLTTLRKAGFIRSMRGPAGGHELLRDPSLVTVLDVIQALEGSLSPVAWLDEPPDVTDHPHAWNGFDIVRRGSGFKDGVAVDLATEASELFDHHPRAPGNAAAALGVAADERDA